MVPKKYPKVGVRHNTPPTFLEVSDPNTAFLLISVFEFQGKQRDLLARCVCQIPPGKCIKFPLSSHYL